jgi:hypothetical protein
MRHFHFAFGFGDVLDLGETRFKFHLFNTLNRASSDSRRSWRGQTTPTNYAYRTKRGLSRISGDRHRHRDRDSGQPSRITETAAQRADSHDG